MARKKTQKPSADALVPAEVTLQPITETIEKNYMPYVMSVIVSRAIPEIDGFKPSHRKLLYTMYKMGLLTGHRTKSANVVGQTMKLNPHGDMAIYETMVRLTKGNEALLHPLIDSKGSFGKVYSRDMAFAASRYTEVKLDAISAEIFRGIDKNAVDFVDNYDNTMKEPVLLPTAFPNILVSPNMGIAVGMASQICSFNLAEVCDGTIAVLKNEELTTDELLDIIKAPDFSGGANLLYDREAMRKIYETGKGNVVLRSRYSYDKEEGCIDITEIPYSTSIEIIIKKITDMIKAGSLKEITDVRDEIDLNGFKLTLDLRRGTDPEKLMAKLFKKTPLQDAFSCNFNILIDGSPRQLGLRGILDEWIRFRLDCLRREYSFDLERKKEKHHLLEGLEKILVDIDKAIRIIRETVKEKDVVPNLMTGFDLDEVQAEFIAEIKLRHLNREYIAQRVREITSLKKEIGDLESLIASERKMKNRIVKQLEEIKKTYAKPRKTKLIYEDFAEKYDEEAFIENYAVKLVLTKEGYFKKITLPSFRMSDEQALKTGDEVIQIEDAENVSELLFVSNKQKIYKAKASDFETKKSSVLGDYIPSKLGFEDGERVMAMKPIEAYEQNHYFIYIFENGRGIRIPISSYETKSARKKLVHAYSDVSPVVSVFYETEPFDLLLVNNAGKGIYIHSSLIPEKATRTAAGSSLFALKEDQKIVYASRTPENHYTGFEKCRKNKLPAIGIAVTKKN
ncbi:MAG: topoisomerase IV [Ruminococcaceae bacterium]|nr:topoisomerase IV [Oscillospiraceae bacterium]